MKLVRINHDRCQEYVASTFVFAPDDWDEDTIDDKVSAACKAYLDKVQSAKEVETNKDPDPYPPATNFNPPYAHNPDMTVREVLKLHEENKKKHQEWAARHAGEKFHFLDFLKKQGFISFYDNEAEDHITEVEAYWGHRHGTLIDYSETNIDCTPTPLQVAQVIIKGNIDVEYF